ncbi:MAG TPA: hypothetical protein VFG71_02550 [Nitrospiraceae bacterium]|nr:hypothetical protein [Nitrospiraceae bacterium]
MRRAITQVSGIDGGSCSRRDAASSRFGLMFLLWACWALFSVSVAPTASGQATEEMQIEITKIGLGKEVVITDGPMEWFMRVEVTPENTVVVRQEKQGERYLVDESETHDRSMTAAEVDSAITDFINHVKVKRQKR